MNPNDLILTAVAGAVCLAICAVLWAIASRRSLGRLVRVLSAELAARQARDHAVEASSEAFEIALIRVTGSSPELVAGADSLVACAHVLGLSDISPRAIVESLIRGDPEHGRRLTALFERGEPCAFAAQGTRGSVSVEGRASGALVWLRLTAAEGEAGVLPTAARFAALIDSKPEPAWIASPDGSPVWVNRAWLAAVQASDLDDAAARRLTFDRAADNMVAEAALAGERRESVRWAPVGGRRRAFRIAAQPLDGGGVGVWAEDVTEQEETAETLRRHVDAHDKTLDHIADGVAIFSEAKRLLFHNTAFAELWGLEPAWLAERPTHGEVLDRLRQRRRLPEMVNYGDWKLEQLGRYETLDLGGEERWPLPDGRTLRVVTQPHPLGGLLLLFSDLTDEVRLKAQYNALIEVQRATLDKLTDAVAVFGPDQRLKLHNEAFEQFWNVTPAQLTAAADFDGVTELCLHRLHDQAFWRDLKARIGDPDPKARAPVQDEIFTSDRRIVSWQSRPLPDGATLISFSDITDTRQLEGALAEREAALDESRRLKRDFVGNVSYELRTPLTTIIGYSELLERDGEGLTERGKKHVEAVRSAATQLARSINDVLDMAQIDAGEMALDIADVDVPKMMADCAARWDDEARTGRVKIELIVDPAIGLIRADMARLSQTLDHLTENALRQTPPDGVVTLSAKKGMGEVRLQVSDTGRGIPFHVQAHIFDRFIGRERGGPGLGLALVKALVELHGGWVALESEPGAGATFTCHLPETAQPAAGQPELF